uniref:acetyl-CoA C-acetyltransferase n=1 Tax=Calidris pygmaea TaxID=425635 RepID=A0A8C3JYN9_9CHAR
MSLRSAGNPGDISSSMMDNSKARDCLIPMGITSENVAEKFGVSRKKQDAFALASQQKAAKAQQMGLFKAEIVPVKTTVVDNQGNRKTVTVHQDEGIRPSTTLEGLAKLKPAFKEDGSTTAGQLCSLIRVVPVDYLPCKRTCYRQIQVLIALFQQVMPAR